MNLELNMRIAGLLMLLVALSHFCFPRWFAWKTELAELSLINRQIFIVQTVFVVLTLVLVATLTSIWTRQILNGGELGRALLTGLAIFWLVRLVVQIFVYDPRLWMGNAGKTTLHLLVTLLCAYLTTLFGWAAFAVETRS
ncbi:MAG: hypothetical protein ACREJD_10605 [Phycisphaerales bacterium]